MSTIGLKAFGNGLSLVGALVFLVLFLIGQDRSLINPWGDRWLSAYLESHSIQFNHLKEQVNKGQTGQAINQLQSGWKDIQKSDRIYKFKSRLLFALATELQGQKRYNELLHWSSEWIRLDERNIDAIAFWYEAIRHFPGREKEGLEGLIKSQRDFPESAFLSRFLIRAYRETGNAGAAESLAHSIARAMAEVAAKGWQVFWHTKNQKGFTEAQSKFFSINADHKGRFSLVAELPSDLNMLRVDPPFHSALHLRIHDIELEVNQRKHRIQISDLRHKQMLQEEDSLVVHQKNDPRFYLPIIKYLGDSGDTGITVKVEFEADLVVEGVVLPLADFLTKE
jgi:hypothetical protein